MPRESPYNRLRRRAVEWIALVQHPRRKVMYSFDSAALARNYNLQGIADRVQAADTLGWRTELRWRNDRLEIVYVENPPDVPWEVS